MVEAPATHRAEEDWTWVETPDPNQMIFAAHVQTQDITLTNKPKKFNPFTEAAPTQFKDLDSAFGIQHLASLGIGDWYFIGESIGSPRSTFYFFKNQTDAERDTPWDVKAGTHEFTWPEVLLKILFTPKSSIPLTVSFIKNKTRGAALLPRWFVLMLKREPRGGMWPTKIYRYLSYKPWQGAAFADLHEKPDPEKIEWDLAGHSYEISCLHKAERVPVQSDNYQTIVGGDTGSASEKQKWRAYKATRMTDWSSFTINHGQQEIAPGITLRTKEIIEAPIDLRPPKRVLLTF